MIRRIGIIAVLIVLLAACGTNKSEQATTSPPPPTPAAVTPDQARAIAKEAYILSLIHI